MKKPQFIIAAPTSNSGKTTLTLGLLRALKNRGIPTQPFKVGPDYIDPKFHKIASGTDSINLDLFMMSEEAIEATYYRYANLREAVVIEGVMGLFDGAKRSERSTAEAAKLLDLPIIFVVDAKSVAYSVAPLLFGFKNFDKSLHIAGVIFNRVSSKSHYKFLQEACEDVGMVALGHLPHLQNAEISSRHLGLSIENIEKNELSIAHIAEALEKNIDIDLLLKSCLQDTPTPPAKTQVNESVEGHLIVAVAKDEAFNFTYIQNIEALKALGKVSYFSPLTDHELPEADLVYLPGGYPEDYSRQLSENTSMLESIKSFAEGGGQVIAECGGMMYLGHAITNKKGRSYPMVNLFPFETSMKSMKLTLGYRSTAINGHELLGHEFHYSEISGDKEIETAGENYSARGKKTNTKLFRYKNVLASYTHYYFGEVALLKQLLNITND